MNRRSVIGAFFAGVAAGVVPGISAGGQMDPHGVVCDYLEAIQVSTDYQVRKELSGELLSYMEGKFPAPAVTAKNIKETFVICYSKLHSWSVDRIRSYPPSIPPELYPLFICKYAMVALRAPFVMGTPGFDWFHETYGPLLRAVTGFKS